MIYFSLLRDFFCQKFMAQSYQNSKMHSLFHEQLLQLLNPIEFYARKQYLKRFSDYQSTHRLFSV